MEGFVFYVKSREFFAGGGEGLEVGGEGDARELALEIGGVAGAVFGVVEEGVGLGRKCWAIDTLLVRYSLKTRL